MFTNQGFRSHQLSAKILQSIPNTWRNHPEFGLKAADLVKLEGFLTHEEANHLILPAKQDRFRALELTSPEQVRVVILGQDPYHGPGQAHGLAFSVKPKVKLPPSLRNILKEWGKDLGNPPPKDGCLERWAQSGVLLLNSCLTVRSGEAQSHAGQGWEKLVLGLLRTVSAKSQPVLFILWGGPARKLAEPILREPHGAIFSAHPSPLSAYRGFFGSKPFSKANSWLTQRGLAPVDWSLD